VRLLGERLGPILVQLPPSRPRDDGLLRLYLDSLDPELRYAFEFRHDSWFDDETLSSLREGGAALCLADTDDANGGARPLVPTASWGYLRLRRAGYSDEDLAGWAQRIRSQPWERAFVFFKHEDEARGPELADRLLKVLG
jgi:uncharacterized protein YecE (DUF72 family)